MTPQQQTERAVIGAILDRPEELFDVIGRIRSDCFVFDTYRIIFEAIEALFQDGRPVDLITLKAHLRDDNLSALCDDAALCIDARSDHATGYADVLIEAHGRRRLSEAAGWILEENVAGHRSLSEMTEGAEARIFDIAATRNESRTITELLGPTLDEIEAATKSEGNIVGIATGFDDLDRITTGWRDSDLTVIAARPGMGKSAFAMQAALYAAKTGTPTAFFSLEMGASQLVNRVLTAEAGIDNQRARRGEISNDEWSRLTLSAGRLSGLPLHIVDTSALSPLELRAQSRRLKLRHNLGLVFVDYLQLMSVPDMRRSANREQEISQISRGLKQLAKELSIPVVALSQLNRGVEHRAGARPQLSDLRESGAIEQDSDNVLFIYRPEYHGIQVDDEGNSTKGVSHLIVAKQRNGPTGEARATFSDGRFYPFTAQRHNQEVCRL